MVWRELNVWCRKCSRRWVTCTWAQPDGEGTDIARARDTECDIYISYLIKDDHMII
jgi:hypothetical protein